MKYVTQVSHPKIAKKPSCPPMQCCEWNRRSKEIY